MEIEKINSTELSVKVYQGQRVVTFKDIDTVHERPEGTAKRNFSTNKKHFIEGEDFFAISRKDVGTDFVQTYGFSDSAPSGMLITESGYLMLVKSFTDDLAWDVQRQLVKSYFRKQTGHHVKKLTVTSRDIAIMANMKSKHHFVLNAIRDIIVELETLGFDSEEFFTESTYIGGNNQPREQFICTERGCEYFSNRLEPQAKREFMCEVKDRFERMQNVLDGKPVKRLPKLISMADVPELEPEIKIYKHGDLSILLMDGGLYNLEPGAEEMIKRLVEELDNSGATQIKTVLQIILENMGKGGKMEEQATFDLVNEKKEPQGKNSPLLPPKKAEVDLNQVENLSVKQAQQRYGIGRAKVVEIADLAGAVIRCGSRVLYSRQTLDDYFKRHTT